MYSVFLEYPDSHKSTLCSISYNRIVGVLCDFSGNKYLWMISKETASPSGLAINSNKRPYIWQGFLLLGTIAKSYTVLDISMTGCHPNCLYAAFQMSDNHGILMAAFIETGGRIKGKLISTFCPLSLIFFCSP